MKYHVETFPIGACVCDETGMNVLSFIKYPGAKFTTPEDAQYICDKWNNGEEVEEVKALTLNT